MTAIALVAAALAAGAIPPAGAPAAASGERRSLGAAPRAPSGPPLTVPASGSQPGAAPEGDASASAPERGASASAPEGGASILATEGDASASAPASGGDPLVENGLGSPLCGASEELSGASRRNCMTSGFEAAGAPTGDYGLDVHIDTGLISLNGQTLLQDYLIEPAWMGLVWVVHALIVALEWCFTLDLLDSSALGGLERGLRATQSSFTGPWLAAALALGSLAAAYNGLVRRRVAETLGQVALMLAMMAGGLWVIADPAGTVGALGRWVDEASVGTLGAVVQGTPVRAPRALAQSMGGLFAAVVGAPWCYLEFGNVSWCEDPARLEPRLRAAGLNVAAIAQGAHCGSGEAPPALCRLLEGEQPRALAQSVRLLRAARTNGELFLALPANAAARNSIQDPGSLLGVLCGSSENATDCAGPTAAEAEFRTQSGTDARVGGLLLIAIGALGMILLLGFIALHLLGAEIVSLFYLLLTPIAVIAPALGDGGRAAFRTWGTRLLGAICSKLLFSFLLGAVLAMTRTLMGLDALGWWSRWLLVTVLWWGAYRQRHQALDLIAGDRSKRGPRERSAHRHTLAQRVKRQLEGPRSALQTAQWVRGKRSGGPPSVGRRQVPERIGVGGRSSRYRAGEQVARMLELELGIARAQVAGTPEIQSGLSAKGAQLQRIRGALADLRPVDAVDGAGSGKLRRAAGLRVRAQRIEGEIEHERLALDAARRTVAEGERAQRRSARAYTPTQARERGRLLDAQAVLPDLRAAAARGGGTAGDRAKTGERRDYAGLAGLAGYGREQYTQLDPRAQRTARLEIDRELALRRELRSSVSPVAASSEPSFGRGVPRRAGGDPGRALDAHLSQHGSAPPRARGDRAGGDGARGDGAPHERLSRDPRGPRPGDRDRGRERDSAPVESAVMRDIREVAAGRKRYLGL